MKTVYTTQTSRIKEREGGFCHLQLRLRRLSEPFAFCKRPSHSDP
jgi:hypothetical protein